MVWMIIGGSESGFIGGGADAPESPTEEMNEEDVKSELNEEMNDENEESDSDDNMGLALFPSFYILLLASPNQ